MVALLLVAMLVAASLWMALAWLVSTRTGRSGFTDVFWTYGTGLAGVAVALVPLDPGAAMRPRQILVAVLVAAWALRLGTHILRRTLKGGDDPRYAKMKEAWGDAADRQMFWFLQIQAGTIAVLVLAVFVAARAPRPGLDARDALGALVALVGIVGEMASDRQLRGFAADPANRGGVCDIGLWRYSRHPNYFFEVVGWWAYPVIAIGFDAYGWGWLALGGPLMIYWLLVHVSGIPPLEDYMVRSRGLAFRAYQARTSAFIPMPPGRG
jgi:steroid 5-alpha reductase family enzyme